MFRFVSLSRQPDNFAIPVTVKTVTEGYIRRVLVISGLRHPQTLIQTLPREHSVLTTNKCADHTGL